MGERSRIDSAALVERGRCTIPQSANPDSASVGATERFTIGSGQTVFFCNQLEPTTNQCRAMNAPCPVRRNNNSQEDFSSLNIAECDTVKGTIKIDTSNKTITKLPRLPEGHEPILLPNHQFLILFALMEQAGRIVSHRNLWKITHPHKYYIESDARTLSTQIQSLRNIIDGEERQKRSGVNREESIIETKRGVGWRLRVPEPNRRKPTSTQ